MSEFKVGDRVHFEHWIPSPVPGDDNIVEGTITEIVPPFKDYWFPGGIEPNETYVVDDVYLIDGPSRLRHGDKPGSSEPPSR